MIMTFVEELSKYIYDNKRYISDIEYMEMTIRCPAGDNDNAKRFTGRGDLEALEEFIVENPPEKGDAYFVASLNNEEYIECWIDENGKDWNYYEL